MKRLALIIFSLLLLFVIAKPSLAKDASPAPFRVRKEAVKENIAERRKTNLSKFLGNMVKRLKAYVVRLETLISRIESRFQKIASEQPDTDLTAIKKDVEKAKTLLAQVKEKITDLEGIESELVDSDSRKETFKDIRAKVASIKKDLTEVHRLLVHVIGDIKGLRVGEDKNEE